MTDEKWWHPIIVDGILITRKVFKKSCTKTCEDFLKYLHFHPGVIYVGYCKFYFNIIFTAGHGVYLIFRCPTNNVGHVVWMLYSVFIWFRNSLTSIVLRSMNLLIISSFAIIFKLIKRDGVHSFQSLSENATSWSLLEDTTIRRW